MSLVGILHPIISKASETSQFILIRGKKKVIGKPGGDQVPPQRCATEKGTNVNPHQFPSSYVYR